MLLATTSRDPARQEERLASALASIVPQSMFVKSRATDPTVFITSRTSVWHEDWVLEG
ncbi:hypothetical protein HYS54_04780 [Candidatus Micrarchaeota archaeon]|nr:hypothetical protein [Candidatus Micrarchaeota archaeon]